LNPFAILGLRLGPAWLLRIDLYAPVPGAQPFPARTGFAPAVGHESASLRRDLLLFSGRIVADSYIGQKWHCRKLALGEPRAE